MTYITVPDENDSVSEITIDDITYNIRFTYNETYDFWTFGLYDENMDAIIAGVRIVSGFTLFGMYSNEDLPDGHFGCICEFEEIGRDDFNNGLAEFVYIPNSEL